MKRKPIIVCLLPLSLLLLSFSLSHSAASVETDETDAHTGFVGAETCQECHEAQYESYSKSVHFKKFIKGPQSQDACETCHGAGAKHVEKGGGQGVDIFAFDKDVDPQAKAAKCLICHQRTPGMDLWDFGAHKRNDVSCDSCHDLHVGSQKPREPAVCFSCHQDVKIDVNKRSHHPILEGKIQCSSCHSPHGSLTRNMVKADDHQQLCFRCHADKRGPVVWEHPPVEENCMTCHDVHGSIHEQLLTERIPQLCQNCHDWSRHPGTPYDDSASFTSRWNCLRCHPYIHGSNSPSGGGMRFVR